MKRQELIKMLNRDLKDEHAAILRYLVHGWLEGEDTPIGASLISRSREEMWHMHWLGFIIASLGGEPDFIPAPYPYDPTNRSTMFKSYVEYEKKLIPHYNSEADMVKEPYIKRVLKREAWESEIHARKFQRILNKLSPKQAKGVPGEERGLPKKFINKLQAEVNSKYNEMIQHIRYSWVFQKKNGILSCRFMDQAMEKMKHIAHFAEDIGGSGIFPDFNPGKIDRSININNALKKSIKVLKDASKRHIKLSNENEARQHEGLLINLDLTIKQELYQLEELRDNL